MKQDTLMTKAIAALTWLGLAAGTAHASTLARAYGFGSTEGNLISNWSFEYPDAFWMEDPPEPGEPGANTRFRALPELPDGAKSGIYVAKVVYPIDEEGVLALPSQKFTFPAFHSYTLSFYFQVPALTTAPNDFDLRPMIRCIGHDGSITDLVGDHPLSIGVGGWVLYTWNFAPPNNVQSAQLYLGHASFVRAGVTAYFDDVVLEEGTWSLVQVEDHRNLYSESEGFSDGLGRTQQTFTKIDDNSFLASATGFNASAEPETTFMDVFQKNTAVPFPDQGPVANLAPTVNGFYNGSGGHPNAGGFAYGRSITAPEPSSRVVEMSSQGQPWSLGQGHTITAGYFLTNSLVPPANIAVPPACNPCQYRVDWSKDKNGHLHLAFTDMLGQKVRTASAFKNASGATDYDTTDFQYFPNGQLKRALTPIDVRNKSTALSETYAYDARGDKVACFKVDAGLVKNWYDRSGKLRFTQDEKQRPVKSYTYYEYDDRGRLISEGTDSIPSMTQAIADMQTFTGNLKRERIGYIYDDLSSFAARTGLSLSDLNLSDFVFNTWGQLVCKYNRNDDLAAVFAPKDRLVAEFFRFRDDQGRLLGSSKYFGLTQDPGFGNPTVDYNLLNDGKLYSEVFHPNSFREEGMGQSYVYDRLGRIRNAVDLDGTRIGDYVYSDWGPLKSLYLGGTGSTVGTKLAFDYHIQRTLSQVTATQLGTNKIIFRQNLGFETKAWNDAKIPAPAQPRWDGGISQVLTKYSGEMSRPVNLANLRYDDLGRMTQDSGYWNTNTGPLDANEEVVWANLALGPAGTTTGLFDHDLNSRITGQRSGGVASVDSAKYVYKTNSNELDHVTGKVFPAPTRNMSVTGNFGYDADGNMTSDLSKSLTIQYDWMGMPCRISAGSQVEYMLYDADGQRAARLAGTTGGAALTAADHYILLMGKSFGEVREELGSTSKTTEVYSLFGRGQVVGRKYRVNGVELSPFTETFYVKNYQGSVMRLVQPDGTYKAPELYTNDFSAYGNPRSLVAGTGPRVTEGFTGKEYEGSFDRLSYFGARFFDPELGLWISHDPAHQFAFPYGFGDPINGVDKNGEWLLSALKAALGPIDMINVISAIHAAVEAGSFWSGVKAFAADFAVNTLSDWGAEPFIGAAGIGGGAGYLGDIANLGTALVTWNGSRLKQEGRSSLIGLWAPLASDINTINNVGVSIGRGHIGEAFSNLGASGFNSVNADLQAINYAANKGWGDQSASFHGNVEGSFGYRANVWGFPSRDGGDLSAQSWGNNIRLYKSYFSITDPNEKKKLLVHEFVHVTQQGRYGVGGLAIRYFESPTETRKPDGSCSDFGFTDCATIEGVNANIGGERPNVLEEEAYLNGNAGQASQFWFDAPVY